MKVRQFLSAIAVLTSTSTQAAEVCMQPQEVKADQIRFVDTQLRIAALQCVNAGLRDMTMLYNDFARSKRPYFIEATKPLKEFLKRTKRGSIDRYVVSMANQLSLDSAQQTKFCDRSRFAMQMSTKMPNPAGLITLMPISYQQPERTCAGNSSADLYN